MSPEAIWRRSQTLRQYRMDFSGHFEPKTMTRPPRLLLMACSATKKPVSGPARAVYNGPLYQTLRTVDPTGDCVDLAVISAKYGLISGDQIIEPYNAVIDDAARDRMIAAGPDELYPVGSLDQTTPSGLRAARARLGARASPASTIITMGNSLGGQYTDIGIAGGHRYIDVVQSWLARGWPRAIDPRARVPVINGEIGNMRKALRSWIERPEPSHQSDET